MGVDGVRQNNQNNKLWWSRFMILTVIGILIANTAQGQTLPPPEDIPEEVLRTEIILEGRSPVDGQALTATEYTELMELLAENPNPPQINAELRHLIFLLRVRRMIKTFIPFI